MEAHRVCSGIVLLWLVFCLTGCGGNPAAGINTNGLGPDAGMTGTDGKVDAPVAGFDLPAPADVLALSRPRSASAAVLYRMGSDFMPGLAQRAAASGTSVNLTPEWVDGSSPFSTAAYAVYHFNVTASAPEPTLHLAWNEQPAEFTKLWIGLSHWQRGCWQWFAGPPDGELSLGASGLKQYAQTGTGELFAAVVLLGTAPASLKELSLGGVTSSAWPMFGHDSRHTCRSPYIGTQSGKLKWTYHSLSEGFPCQEAVAGPDGTIYVASGSALFALNTDGSLKWRSLAINPSSLPVLAEDGTIYVGSFDCNLYALNADGSVRWTYTTGFPVYGSPAVNSAGTILLSSDLLYAINPDGSLKWSANVLRNRTVVLGADDTMYFHYTESLLAYDPDGNLKWSYPTQDEVNCMPPAVGLDGTIYVGGSQLYAVNPDGSLKWTYDNIGLNYTPVIRADGDIRITTDSGQLNDIAYALDAAGGLLWEYEIDGPLCSAPAVAGDGTMYVVSKDSCLYSIAPDGSLNWVSDGTVNHTHPPLVGSDGTIYTDMDHAFRALDPTGVTKWSFTTGSYLGIPVIGTDGTVYVSSGCGAQLEAVNPDGTLKWIYNDKAGFAPAVGADGTVYATGTEEFFALTPAGNLEWKASLGGAPEAGPIIGADGTVYLSNGDKISAFDAGGAPQWEYEIAAAGTFSTMAAIANDGSVYAVDSQGILHALDTDGALKWTDQLDGQAACWPAIDTYGSIYIGIEYSNSLQSINPDGTANWICSLAGRPSSRFPALAANGTLYIGCDDGKLYAFGTDGSSKWVFDTGMDYCSPLAVSADGTVFFGANRRSYVDSMGRTIILPSTIYALGPDNSVIWSHTAGGPITAPAIGTDGTVYFGCLDGSLYAFGD